MLRCLTQSGGEEGKTLAKIRTLWGKVYHTWVSGTDYPRGPARLFWSVTGEEPSSSRPTEAPAPVEGGRGEVEGTSVDPNDK